MSEPPNISQEAEDLIIHRRSPKPQPEPPAGPPVPDNRPPITLTEPPKSGSKHVFSHSYKLEVCNYVTEHNYTPHELASHCPWLNSGSLWKWLQRAPEYQRMADLGKGDKFTFHLGPPPKQAKNIKADLVGFLIEEWWKEGDWEYAEVTKRVWEHDQRHKSTMRWVYNFLNRGKEVANLSGPSAEALASGSVPLTFFKTFVVEVEEYLRREDAAEDVKEWLKPYHKYLCEEIVQRNQTFPVPEEPAVQIPPAIWSPYHNQPLLVSLDMAMATIPPSYPLDLLNTIPNPATSAVEASKRKKGKRTHTETVVTDEEPSTHSGRKRRQRES
ncbi:hypothetical protein HDV00_006440 [Rhizophlyctis rosea]|nr:hypothetical protein HDV00_006440 [Rhizophlyctis rosea]